MMGHALRITTNAKMGPVVAALAALAAGTLVAVTIMFQTLGPIAVDHPAHPLQPGGSDRPLVVGVPPEPITAPITLAGVLAADLPTPVPPAQADDLLPSRTVTGVPITSVIDEERFEPAPREETLIGEVQQRISEIVRTVSGRETAAAVAVTPSRPNDKERKTKERATRAPRSEIAVAVTDALGKDEQEIVEQEGVEEEVAEVLDETDVLPEELGAVEPQPEPPTAAGSASPVL